MKRNDTSFALTSLDELFSTQADRDDAQREKVMDIPLSDLHAFKGHPFKVLDDEKMMETVESVKQYGVLVPAIARPDPEGGYEIVSGHRRHRASQLAGMETMPVIVRDLDDDAAIIIMVDSNLQRETLLPSERAFAYKMKLDAMKHQGKRLSDDSLSDNGAEVLAGNEANHMTSAQVGPKCDTDGNDRADNSENRQRYYKK